MDIYKNINDIMKEVGSIGKDQVNLQQKFKYRGVEAILNALSPLLQLHGVMTVPTVIARETQVMQVGSNQTSMIFTYVRVKYDLFALDGSSVVSIVDGESMDTADKSTPKAMSVAWRTMAIQVFALATGDGDTETVPYSTPEHTTHSAGVYDPWAQGATSPTCSHGKMKPWTAPDSGRITYYCTEPKGSPDQCASVKGI